MPTPHNTAKIEDIAKTVLMPGDPLRAKFIAETFLTEPRLVNNVRGVQGYTGTWKGVPVTVMASGMGIPSIGIYSWELFNFYKVENIIRIGSAGALQDDLKLRDLVAGQAACTNSNYVKNFGLGEAATYAPIADFTLLSKAVEAGREHGVEIRVGNLLASDTFYSPEGCGKNDEWKRMGVLAVEKPPRRRPPDLLHPDDGDRAGYGSKDGQDLISRRCSFCQKIKTPFPAVFARLSLICG